MAEQIIEISGCDYVGKSTQASLTAMWTLKHAKNLGGFGSYCDEIPKSNGPDSWNWWFEGTSLAEFGGALLSAYAAREKEATVLPHDLVVVERGLSMVKAQIAANFATRGERRPEDYFEQTDGLADIKLGRKTGVTKHEVVLHSDKEWSCTPPGINRYLRQSRLTVFSPYQTEFYTQYQENLGIALGHYAPEQHCIPVVVNGPAVDIQNIIRRNIATTGLNLPPLLEQEPFIVGLSGLSECGKGTIAQELATRFRFTRLKLGYFNEATRDRSTYADPKTMCLNVLHFLCCNRHMKRVSFESIAAPELPAELKATLGDRWKLIYIDLPTKKREQRLLEQQPDTDPVCLLNDQHQKDLSKRFAGIEKCREIADILVDNSGKLEVTISKIAGELDL